MNKRNSYINNYLEKRGGKEQLRCVGREHRERCVGQECGTIIVDSFCVHILCPYPLWSH